LPGGLTGGIHIKDDEATTLSVEDPPDGISGPSLSETLLLKKGTEGFQTGTIDICQKATQTGPMRTTSASKQGHERRSKGGDSRTKRF
jgi:hypothetical protein